MRSFLHPLGHNPCNEICIFRSGRDNLYIHLITHKPLFFLQNYAFSFIIPNIIRTFLARLSSTPIPQLVEYFNQEVGSCAWTTERGVFDATLTDALFNKSIDVSAVYDGSSTCKPHRARIPASPYYTKQILYVWIRRIFILLSLGRTAKWSQ